MCGIAGVVDLEGAPVDPVRVERMIQRLTHRGPDDLAIFTDGPAGLGHARLSILDIAGGQQPMPNEDGTVWITFNGEIFNYLELKADLEMRGHRFATRSDTEVLLHLYEEHGADCVRLLNGQWAFAIWDGPRRTMLLSRDRLGVRPLFFTADGNSFAFASEIKALTAVMHASPSLDHVALDQIFTFWSALAPRTPFKDVSELPPGHSLLVTRNGIRSWSYWQLDFEPRPPDSHEAERLHDLLTDATRVRLRSDVPVGAYLSGGLDSTAVAALAKRVGAGPLCTFSVTFADPRFDESAYQQAAVAYLGTAHDTVHCSDADIARVFPEVIWHAEKPLLRTAPAPLFLLSQRVRERGYKVVLTGEGADEILGGYDIFKEAKIRRFWGRFPQSRLRPLLLRRLYPYLANVQTQPDSYLRAFFNPGTGGPADPFFSHRPRWELTSRLKIFYSAELQASLKGYDATAELHDRLPSRYRRWDPFFQAQYLETAFLLPGYILSSQGDRMAMSHSVEGRFPFLDHRVVEFAASLPATLKMRGLDEKYLLKRAVRDLVPEMIRRRKKQPYRAPDAKSFFAPDGRAPDYVEELLSPDRIRRDRLFNPAAVAKLVAKARSGDAIGVKDNMGLVALLSTELLVDRFIESFSHENASQRDSRVHRRELPVRAGR